MINTLAKVALLALLLIPATPAIAQTRVGKTRCINRSGDMVRCPKSRGSGRRQQRRANVRRGLYCNGTCTRRDAAQRYRIRKLGSVYESQKL